MLRDFVMLAQVYNKHKCKPEGSYVSEKLDGMRCVWLPGTRNKQFKDISFANTNKDTRDHKCTGLWSRYAKPIMAPDWFLDTLPNIPLDGELFLDRGRFQETLSITKQLVPDDRWHQIGYYVFDIPSYGAITTGGKINNPNHTGFITQMDMLNDLDVTRHSDWFMPRRFELNYIYLSRLTGTFDPGELKGAWGTLKQTQLPFSRFVAEKEIENLLTQVNENNGEGLILRRPHSEWKPKRTDELTKVKPSLDSEGIIIGYTGGTGKLYGMIGSFRVRALLNNQWVEFDLSGFTDAEREAKLEYRNRLLPGIYFGESVSDKFPIGTKVTFKYRELTDDGLPKEARYHRIRVD